MVGQTVRGKGSKGPGCPGEGDPLLQKCPHQASGYGPGPAEVRSQCARRSVARTKGNETGLPWQAEQLGSGRRSLGREKRFMCKYLGEDEGVNFAFQIS